MPADTYGAIFAYNHADWYVADVLANAACYADEVGAPAFAASLGPQLQVLKCTPAPAWRERIPHEYLRAFEDAAARYELGKRGVWALAAIAHLESDFGRGMGKKQLREQRAARARRERVARLRGRRRRGRQDPPRRPGRLGRDAGATDLVARQPQRRHLHPQPGRVVRAGGPAGGRRDRGRVQGPLRRLGAGAAGNRPRNRRARRSPAAGDLASAPENAPAAVKAAIAAANSIASTPYVWGGGHGSWYSYGYDCSGAVSFALYGAGLLDTPLVSGSLASYGEPGPGKWITIYANASHTYMTIAGLRFDTAGNPDGVSGPRWHTEPPYPEGYEVRHPAGY